MDFRGYLAQNAPAYLKFTGNDAVIDPTKGGYDTNFASYANTAANRQTVQKEVSDLYGRYQQSQNPSSIPGMNFGGGSYTPPIPKLDLAGIYSQAQNSSGVQATNRYYASTLNNFVQQQAADKAAQQQLHDLNLNTYNQDLTNSLNANEISRGRTSQGTLTNEQQLGQQFDRAQQDQGTQFDQERLNQAKSLATSGMTTSGLGQGQIASSQVAHNLGEERQAQDNQEAMQAQELLKHNTFEDLANSDTLHKQDTSNKTAAENINWNSFVQNQGFALTNKTGELEQNRLKDVGEQARQAAKQQVLQFINSLSNPAQKVAAAQAYGGAF